MKIVFSTLVLATLLVSQVLFAHGDHQHGPIPEFAAQALALNVAEDLSSRDAGLSLGRLAKTWASVPAENATISKKGKGYYIVAVFNESEKRTLYILMSDQGEVYDVNFTEEFKGIK